MDNVVCAEIKVSFLPEADYCLVPICCPDYTGFNIEEILKNEIEYLEGETDIENIKTIISFKEYEKQELIKREII